MVKNFENTVCTVYTQYRRVTDRQTYILPRHSPRYAYASRGKNISKCHRSVTSSPGFSSEAFEALVNIAEAMVVTYFVRWW